MADRPILFSGPMVRATLREIEKPGTGKTQTRRVLKPQPRLLRGATPFYQPRPTSAPREWHCCLGDHIHNIQIVPYAAGDRLYVRENFYLTDDGHNEVAVYAADEVSVARHINEVGNVAARNGLSKGWLARHVKLRPSIHMPRWASRITLYVTEVRVHRIQEISADDCEAEGIESELWDQAVGYRNYLNDPGGWFCTWPDAFEYDAYVDADQIQRRSFQSLWDSLDPKPGFTWSDNPWVAAYTFIPKLGNIDSDDMPEVLAA